MNDDDDTLIFRPRPFSVVWLSLLCGGGIAFGMWIPDNTWVSYFVVVACALLILFAIVRVLPGSTYLQISKEGFSYASTFRVTTIPWSAIDHFFVYSHTSWGLTIFKVAGFHFVPSFDRARIIGRIRSQFIQWTTLPDTYGQNAGELADLLNARLEDYRQGA